MKKIILLALFFLSVVTACKKDKENEVDKDQRPTFTSLKIGGKEYINATEEIEIYLGEAFDFEVSVSDDVELSELQVEIHSAFDAHSHENTRAREMASSNPRFGPIVKSLSGKSDTKSFSVFSATDTHFVHGTYHLEMILLDEAGNRVEKIVELHLEEKE